LGSGGVHPMARLCLPLFAIVVEHQREEHQRERRWIVVEHLDRMEEVTHLLDLAAELLPLLLAGLTPSSAWPSTRTARRRAAARASPTTTARARGATPAASSCPTASRRWCGAARRHGPGGAARGAARARRLLRLRRWRARGARRRRGRVAAGRRRRRRDRARALRRRLARRSHAADLHGTPPTPSCPPPTPPRGHAPGYPVHLGPGPWI